MQCVLEEVDAAQLVSHISMFPYSSIFFAVKLTGVVDRTGPDGYSALDSVQIPPQEQCLIANRVVWSIAGASRLARA